MNAPDDPGEWALQRIAHFRAQAEAAALRQDQAARGLREWIGKAVAAGVASGEVARVAGVSPSRVSQLAPRARGAERGTGGKRARGPARDATPDTAPDTAPDTPAEAVEPAEGAAEGPGARTLPAEAPLLSGRATTKKLHRYGRGTGFYDPRLGVLVDTAGRVASGVPGEVGTVAHVLASVAALAADTGAAVGRVYLVGPRPADTSGGATLAEATRAWALADPRPGWTAGAHYLADPDTPVLRFASAEGPRVVLMRAAAWWGETEADVDTCRRAWVGLDATLEAIPAFAGAGLADTPATTGRALWLRTIPEGRAWPVPSDELRELLAATTGQGRIERRPAPVGGRAPSDFTYVDGRFMYSALTWGMPVGEPRRWTGAELDRLDGAGYGRAIRGRGRWRITVTVPDGWAHVGMFAAPAEAGGWCYPDRPGQRFTTWADGCEVWAGMVHGWEPIIHEGITWAEGKPLNTWTEHLVAAWQSTRAAAEREPAAELAGRAIRAVLLYGLGAFATRAHPVTRSAPIDGPTPDIPRGTEVRRVGESLVWSEPGKLSEWSAACAHPEWAACVWARARTRLLDAAGPQQSRVGALHLPPERVVAFATDALYLAGGDPGWPDDGKPGRFRVKGIRPGGFDWPETAEELYRLRDAAAADNGEAS